LNELRYAFITSFEHYVRTVPIKACDPCTNNGTMKHLERLRKMISWAVKNEWIESDPFEHYKLHFKHRERGFLTADEMKSLEQAELDIPQLQRVRDLFLFSCYTGLSFVDIISLRPHNIVKGKEGVQWISTARTKTDVAVTIPLLQPASLILDKFKDDKAAIVNEKVFPPISNQEMNRSFKNHWRQM
jgi:site-specific recombinase XerD